MAVGGGPLEKDGASMDIDPAPSPKLLVGGISPIPIGSDTSDPRTGHPTSQAFSSFE